MASGELSYAGARLDRVSAERRDPAWVASRVAERSARALLVDGVGVRVTPEPFTLVRAALPELPGDAELVLLGITDDGPLFAADVPEGAGPGEPISLRDFGARASGLDAGLAAYAAALTTWHRRHRFCGRCSAPTRSRAGGIERVCPACATTHHPRADPVVIVRVADADRLLLGRQQVWPEGRYSVLAGYVEPGETLEAAVHREVREESGIALGTPRYVASQPWPFPWNLMLGFEAEAATPGQAPRADGVELADVRWADRDEVAAAAAGSADFFLPPPISIARGLIDAWLERGPR